jgi:hypothetical protein
MPTPIDTPPTAPNSGSPTNFSALMDAFLAYFVTLVAQLNAWLVSLGIIAAGGGTATSYVFDTGTADADPGANKIRFNNATQNAGTLISVNLTDANGVNMTSFFATLGLSTNVSSKAQVKLTKLADPTKWLEFKVTAYAATTYGDITGTFFASSAASPFANGDVLTVSISITGDKGDKGDAGTIGLGAATPASGNVTLTNASSALQRVAGSAFGMGATLPDATTMPTLGMPIFKFRNTGEYPYYIADKGGTVRSFCYPGETVSADLHDKSTTAGLWDLEDGHLAAVVAQFSSSSLALGTTTKVQAITLDSDRVMLLFGDTTCEAVVYTRSAGTFGTPVSVRATLSSGQFYGILAATDKVLVISDAGTPTTTSLQGVILSTAAAVITVNTAANPTLAAAASAWSPAIVSFNGSFGYGYIRNNGASSQAAVIGISVTGTTVAFGTDSALGTTGNGALPPHLYVSGSTMVALSNDKTNINARPYTIAGSTLTAGTAATVAANANTIFKTAAWGSRWLIASLTNAASGIIADVTLSGTTCTLTSIAASTVFTGTATTFELAVLSATKVAVATINATPNAIFNVLTDNGSGTISAGTAVVIGGSALQPIFVTASGTTARMTSTEGFSYSVDCSGASPVVTVQRFLASSANVAIVPNTADSYMLQRNYTLLTSGSVLIPLPTAGTQLSMLAQSMNAMRLLSADFMPVGTVGCVGADATESWIALSSLTNGIFLQLVKAATP